ncbi:MAG TPA: hypothetical protein VJA40_02935 [archaeon]|nr:hypothetical protein [archaeon]
MGHQVLIAVPQGQSREAFLKEAREKLKSWAGKNGSRVLERHFEGIPANELIDQLYALEKSCPDQEFIGAVRKKLGLEKTQSIALKAFESLSPKECVAYSKKLEAFAAALEKKYVGKKEQPHGAEEEPDFAGQEKFLQFEHATAACRYYANWYRALGELGWGVESGYRKA